MDLILLLHAPNQLDFAIPMMHAAFATNIPTIKNSWI